MKRLLLILLFTMCACLVTAYAQEVLETELIWQSSDRILGVTATDCNAFFFAEVEWGTGNSKLFRYDLESQNIREITSIPVGDSLSLTRIGQNPVSGELVMGYWGGILLSYDCGETWEFPPVPAPESNCAVLRFDSDGRFYSGSGSGDDPNAYWTDDYVTWHKMCYLAFARSRFDVSPEGTVISIQDGVEDVYRVNMEDSCEVIIEARSIPEDPEAAFSDVYSKSDNVWLLSGVGGGMHKTTDDGDTWTYYVSYSYGLDNITKVTSVYDLGYGISDASKKISLFLSRDLFRSSIEYIVDFDASLRDMELDSLGHVWFRCRENMGSSYYLFRSKESIFPLVSSPTEEQEASQSLIKILSKSITLQRLDKQVTIYIYDVTGRLVRSGSLTGLRPVFDCSSLTGPFIVVAESTLSGEVERRAVHFY